MIPQNLDFLNKNVYRKYPIWSNSDMQTVEGVQLPLGLFSSCRLSTAVDYAQLYISRIRIVGTSLSVSISEYTTSDVVGVFNGTITSNFQKLELHSFVPFISGTLTLGLTSVLSTFNGMYNLTYDNGRIEDSLIFCYARPSVHSLQHNTKSATGNITLVMANLAYAIEPVDSSSSSSSSNVVTDFNFEASNLASIASKNDKGANFGTCDNPVILSINQVPPDGNGNIDIYAIQPIALSVTARAITTGTTMTLAQFCPTNTTLPPDVTQDVYNGFLETLTPEWQNWIVYGGNGQLPSSSSSSSSSSSGS